MRFTALRRFNNNEECPSEKICLAMRAHTEKIINTARYLERFPFPSPPLFSLFFLTLLVFLL
jgi:hypothetical protein